MDTIHFLYPDETGCIYCKRINGLIKILPMKTPCLTCGKLAGTIQGAGCECVWNDFDFENGGIVDVFDPLAEYDRINQFKTVPKKKRLAVWEHRNDWAHSKYVQAQNEAFSEPEQKLSARREKRREKLREEVRTLSEALKEYGVEPPVGFPYVSEKDMEDWLALWQRFKRK